MHTLSYWLAHNWMFCPGDFVICLRKQAALSSENPEGFTHLHDVTLSSQ
jgi:hypothetical protein